ncbi:hypothetical protein J1605_021543 [Eschrichtius robustus]|uniref:Uncharacterized protein n=1 Tax=Eschrichtius robustus TaxID=9764 RepID=A0AB34HG18_ESCRO|nr:hypothetical protein J1605_021543 [Eschrichtius robustus]
MQSPAVLVTSRRVQNVHTGLDLTVPQHQEVRGKMMSGHVEYQILVVTRLAAFKSAKHRPEDVVQFLVSWGLCQDAPEVAASLNLTTPDTAEVPETPAPPRPVEAEPVTRDTGRSRSAHHPADPGSDNSDSSNHGGTSGDNAGTRQHL